MHGHIRVTIDRAEGGGGGSRCRCYCSLEWLGSYSVFRVITVCYVLGWSMLCIYCFAINGMVVLCDTKYRVGYVGGNGVQQYPA